MAGLLTYPNVVPVFRLAIHTVLPINQLDFENWNLPMLFCSVRRRRLSSVQVDVRSEEIKGCQTTQHNLNDR